MNYLFRLQIVMPGKLRKPVQLGSGGKPIECLLADIRKGPLVSDSITIAVYASGDASQIPDVLSEARVGFRVV